MTERLQEQGSSFGRTDLAKGNSRRAASAKLRRLVRLAGVVAVVGALAGVGCGSASQSQPTATAQATPVPGGTPTVEPTPKVITIAAGNNPAKGPADAKVTIIEFADFQGLKCGSFATDTLPQIMVNYGDKVRFVFMNLLLTKGDQYSEKAAEAGECAYSQGAFWQYHDLLFENQSMFADLSADQTAADVAQVVGNLKSYAAQLGLDTASFNDCLDSGTMASAVQADQQVAQQAVWDAGLTSGIVLPAFFVNGRYLGGAKPYATFQQAIEYVMAVDKGQ